MNNTKTQTYTYLGRCTPVGSIPPPGPQNWKSVGYISGCTLADQSNDLASDSWRYEGIQRVSKITVPSSGDLAIDCCSNLHGIANSVECSSNANWKPYSWDCNNVMQKQCNPTQQVDPLRHNFDGSPLGQAGCSVKQPCSGYTKHPPLPYQPPKQSEILTQSCNNYLRNAPPNNFFYNHDYKDYPRNFPRHSYTMPQFSGEWGYQPMRTPYKPYNQWEWKDRNTYCRNNPRDCDS